jgi:hypothetical protein
MNSPPSKEGIMKTWFLIAAVVLSVGLLLSVVGLPPVTVSAEKKVQTTVSQCTKNCATKYDNCLKIGKASRESCKSGLNICQNEICGNLKEGTSQSSTPPAGVGPKK